MFVKWHCKDYKEVNVGEFCMWMYCDTCKQLHTDEPLYFYHFGDTASQKLVEVEMPDTRLQRMQHILRDETVHCKFTIRDLDTGTVETVEEDCPVQAQILRLEDKGEFLPDRRKIAQDGLRLRVRQIRMADHGWQTGFVFLNLKSGKEQWMSGEECIRRGFFIQFRLEKSKTRTSKT